MFQKAFHPPRKLFSPPMTVGGRKNSQLIPISPTTPRKLTDVDETNSSKSKNINFT
jgi:hypothetical protein